MSYREFGRIRPIDGTVRITVDVMNEHVGDDHDRRLLTVDQAAGRLGVGVRFVRRLIAERRIRYFTVGRHVRLSDDDLDAFLAAAAVAPRRGDPEAAGLWTKERPQSSALLP